MQITTARSSPEPRGRTSASGRLAGGHREPAKHPHGPPAASRLHRTSGQPFRTRGIAPCGGPRAVDGSTTWPRARHEPRHHVPGASWRDTVPGTVNAPGRWPCPPIADRSERNRWMCPACGREDPRSRPVPGGGFRRRHEWRASPVCIPPPALPSDAVDRVGFAMRRLSRGGPLPCASVSPRTAPKADRPMRLAPVRDAGATSADDPTDGHSGYVARDGPTPKPIRPTRTWRASPHRCRHRSGAFQRQRGRVAAPPCPARRATVHPP